MCFRSSVFPCSILKLSLDIGPSVRRPEIGHEAVIRVYVLSTPPLFVVFIWETLPVAELSSAEKKAKKKAKKAEKKVQDEAKKGLFILPSL